MANPYNKLEYLEVSDETHKDGTNILKLRFPSVTLASLKSSVFKVRDRYGFSLTEYIRCHKSIDESFTAYSRRADVPKVLVDFIEEVWDSVEPLTFTECIIEPNAEKRRVLFSCLGPERLFNSAEKTLLDKQTITKKRVKWDDVTLDKIEYEFEDTYELYRIDSNFINMKLEAQSRGGRSLHDGWGSGFIREDIYSVRCWCTTTNKEFWLMVDPQNLNLKKPDAIEAIASTIWIREANPKRIYRQGDVIFVEHWGDDRDIMKERAGPITKKTYLTKMYSET